MINIDWDQDLWGDYISVLGYTLVQDYGVWWPMYEGFMLTESQEGLTLEQAKRACEQHYNEP